MVIWFRHGECTVGVEDGIIRRDDFAAFVSLLEAADSIEAERQQMLAQAQADIEQMKAQAQSEIDSFLENAKEKQQQGYQSGLAQGIEESSATWTQQALRRASGKKQQLERETERLTQLVTAAVERIVEQEDPVSLHRKAIQTVTKLMRDVPMLTLRVSDLDLSSAQQAVNSVLANVGQDCPIEVISDATLPTGSCLFESDHGVVDAGLNTQLNAIKKAVSRISRQFVLESSQNAAEEEGQNEDEEQSDTDTDTDPDSNADDSSVGSPQEQDAIEGHEANAYYENDYEDDEDENQEEDDDPQEETFDEEVNEHSLLKKPASLQADDDDFGNMSRVS
jgi:type III secretion protein L